MNLMYSPDHVNNQNAKVHPFTFEAGGAGFADDKEKYWYKNSPAVICDSNKTGYVIGSVLLSNGDVFFYN